MMEIVIDISEDLYKATVNGLDANEIWDLRLAIKNGTPLPKGHGDLIDRQELLKSTLCKTFGLRSVDIENTPTVIEADAESENME